LTRTLYHEKIHVEQFRLYGAEFVQNHRSLFDTMAYDGENEYVKQLKEAGRL